MTSNFSQPSIFENLFEHPASGIISQQCLNIFSIINEAKRFLIKNPIEKKFTAARIFNIKSNALNISISQHSEKKHNKMLENHEIQTIYHFIRLLLMHNILLTNEIVFSAIVELKRAEVFIFFDSSR